MLLIQMLGSRQGSKCKARKVKRRQLGAGWQAAQFWVCVACVCVLRFTGIKGSGGASSGGLYRWPR